MKRIAIASVVSFAALLTVAYISAGQGYRAGLADAPGLIKSPEASFTVAVTNAPLLK